MKKKNGVNYSTQLKVNSRRKSVIERLELQLKSGNKTTKEGNVKLLTGDISRINKEISILKSRIV